MVDRTHSEPPLWVAKLCAVGGGGVLLLVCLFLQLWQCLNEVGLMAQAHLGKSQSFEPPMHWK